VIHRLAEIMEESSLECEYWISSDQLGYRLSDIGDFLRVHEDILSVAGTESELPNQWYDLLRDTDHAHLIDRLATEIIDEFVGIGLIFLDDFLDTSGLDPLIGDEILE
jgi:hypothetical protein